MNRINVNQMKQVVAFVFPLFSCAWTGGSWLETWWITKEICFMLLPFQPCLAGPSTAII